MKETKNKQPMCLFTIETSEKRKDRDGAPYEIKDAHDILTFGRVAEKCAKYLRKGSKLYVEGKIRSRSWDDQKGTMHHSYSVLPQVIEFLPVKGEKYKELSLAKDPYETQIIGEEKEPSMEL